MKTNEELLKENAELKLALGIAASFPVKVRMECRKLIKSGSFSRDFISMLHNSANRAISESAAQHLADIKADAVIEAIEKCNTNAQEEDSGERLIYVSDLVDHANLIKEN